MIKIKQLFLRTKMLRIIELPNNIPSWNSFNMVVIRKLLQSFDFVPIELLNFKYIYDDCPKSQSYCINLFIFNIKSNEFFFLIMSLLYDKLTEDL